MAKAFPNTGATVIDTVADLPAASAALEGVMVFQKDSNELKICDGSSWVSVIDTDVPPAMQLMNPTSVAGTGVTNTNGNIAFSASSTISVNGCFTSSFDNYLIMSYFDSSVVDASLNIRLRASGTDNSGTSYAYQSLNLNNTSISGSRTTTTSFYIGNVTSSGPSNARINFLRPALAQHTGYISEGMQPYLGNAWSYYNMGNHQVTTAYDGFTIFPSTGTVTGNLRVYGHRNSI